MKTSGVTTVGAEEALAPCRARSGHSGDRAPVDRRGRRPGAVHILGGEDERLEFWTVCTDRVERLVPLTDGRAEVVCWRRGVEVSRVVGAVD
jgi:hypothetical protein